MGCRELRTLGYVSKCLPLALAGKTTEMATNIEINKLPVRVQTKVLLAFEAAPRKLDNGKDSDAVAPQAIEVTKFPRHPLGTR